jgi:hypothetical protein
MAKVYISEYGGPGPNKLNVAMESTMLAERTISLSTVAAVTTVPFDNACNYIRVHTDAICSIAIVPSTASLATINSKRMAADQTEYFGVRGGYYISAISNS